MANVYDCYATAQALGMDGLAQAFKLALEWLEGGASVADVRLRAARCSLVALRWGDRSVAAIWEQVEKELEG